MFYPIGRDDNDLHTERRARHHHGVRCDPSFVPEQADRDPVGTARVGVTMRTRAFDVPGWKP